MSPSGLGYGHGKVILVGEHAVVYGHPAVATGISVGISAEARRGTGRLIVPAWGLEATAGDGGEAGRALGAIIRRLGAWGFDFLVDARIPARAGLGSSAALAVSVARAAAAAVGHAEADRAIDEAVAEAEAVFHGNPSGIDAAASKSGAAGRFRKGEGWRPLRVKRAMTLCVGLSGRPRETSARVGAVARLRERLPAADELLTRLGRLADDTTAALAAGDADALGRTFEVAHGLLARLQLSSPELEGLCAGARAAGAAGAKLTGAGGGGAVIALAPGRERAVLARWRDAGFDGFLATIAATPAGTPGGTPDDGR